MESDVNFVKVASVTDFSGDEGKVVFAGTKRLALFQVAGEFHCIQNYCPHAGGYLGLGPLSGHIVRCPRHSWGFDIKTGDCKTNARYSVTVYPTRVEDGSVYVGLPADTE